MDFEKKRKTHYFDLCIDLAVGMRGLAIRNNTLSFKMYLKSGTRP